MGFHNSRNVIVGSANVRVGVTIVIVKRVNVRVRALTVIITQLKHSQEALQPLFALVKVGFLMVKGLTRKVLGS